MDFPIKPLLDRIIIREIPIEEIYEKSALELDITDSRRKESSDRGVVVAIGDCISMGGLMLPMPVSVGQTVMFEETCKCNPVYLNPSDKVKTDIPRYFQMRVSDLNGIILSRANETVQ